MRLVCPSCGAQYAVDDNVIPDTGRDVQCSGCGTTWFQEPTDRRYQQAQEPPHSTLSNAPESDILRETIRIAAMPPTIDENQAAKRRSLDSAVLDVLREEAQREKAARASEAPPPLRESEPTPEAILSPEEGLQGGPAHNAKTDTKGEDAVAAVAALSGSIANRGEMLPDIEEINSTLRASADPARTVHEHSTEAPEEESLRSRKGFRVGFGLMVVIFLSLTLLYMYGPKLTASVPELEKPITRYVSKVDTARRWLDRTLRGEEASERAQ